jgi:ornithine cyclodeaminase/alanine dehydrogenase-like protein (mu-crystallin family)
MGLFEPLLDLLVVEADPLPRTGAASGVATKWLSRPEASELAMIGTGKQAITQV